MRLSSATCVRVWLAWLLAFLVVCTPFAAPAPSLPDGWSSRDIGIVGTRGVALGRGGAFILRGAGSSIGDRADSFQFAYTTLTGDGEIVAQVTEIVGSEDDATAGVMLRESLTANARFAYMGVSANRGLAFERRGTATTVTTQSTASTTTTTAAPSTGAVSVAKLKAGVAATPLPPSRRPTSTANIIGSAVDRQPETRSAASDVASTTAGGNDGTPCYLRLVRRGNVITSYKSQDGTTWTLVGTDTIPMASTIYAGLVVNSHNLNSLATATFTAVRLTPGTPAPAPETVTAAVTPTVVSPLPPATPPASSTPPPSTPPVATPETTTPASSSSGSTPDPGTTIALMQWNIHHGIGTDGVLDPDRIARWVALLSPNVVSLNEVDTPELAEQLRQRVEANTGQAWTAWYYGSDTLLLTRLSVQATSVCTTNASVPRMSPHVSVLAGGKRVNIWSVHLSVNSAGERTSELRALQSCASQWPEARVLAGDFNMQASSGEYALATESFVDAWPTARDSGVAVNFDGNCDGCTRNSRIDYIFASRGASSLTLQLAQVFDTRDSNGYMPSDHRPMLVLYAVH